MDSGTWNQIKDLIADVLELPPAERDTIIRARCTDPRLRAQIHAFLTAEDRTRTSDQQAFPSSATDSEDLASGTLVGPYVVISRLGGGGMSRVFLAEDTRLHRKVVLKRLLQTPQGDAAERARILREACAAAQVNHPHVAVVHDVLEYERRAVIVLEFVEGQSLASVLRRGRMPVDRVVAIGRQLASALSAAHARGVVHRDLKPANIQVTPGGDVKVLDFGIAALTSAFTTITADAGPAAELVGRQAGTPGYMSPEQLRGHQIDERTDVFSLGVVLFEMATGERAFRKTEWEDLRSAVSQPTRRADGVDPTVPRRLADVIGRALAPDPADRYQSAAALFEALAAPAPAPGHVRRSAAATIGRAVVVVLTAAGLVLFLGFFINTVFNLSTGRGTEFGRESAMSLFGLGLRSLVGPFLYIATILAVVWTSSFLWRVARLSPSLAAARARVRAPLVRLSSNLALNTASGFAQATVAVVVVLLAIVVWVFSDVLLAVATSISEAPADRLRPLRYDLRYAPTLYRVALSGVALLLVAALIRVRRSGSAGDPVSRWTLVPLLILIGVTTLLAEAPYRLFWNNATERVDYAGERCYVLGRRVQTVLLYCPDREAPRVHAIDASDPAARFTNVRESIFTPPDAATTPGGRP